MNTTSTNTNETDRISGLSDDQLRKRMIGCWLGKAVGGTLGMPYEGVGAPLALTFYDPVPTEMLPNDDLDLQVIYAFLLDQMDKPHVDRHVLSAAWEHIDMSCDEYGVVKRNLAMGLVPPVTGSYDNWFSRGMGAAIRTEIWACLAPGNPELAAAYAYEDACMDHAGEGIWAAVFLAAIQAQAFVDQDSDRLLDVALEHIPGDSQLKQAIVETRIWWAEKQNVMAVRDRILRKHGHENFTDVVMNLAFIVLGLLSGKGDFGKSICDAVNCGMDTDCTGATLGALLGIMDPGSIDEKWLKPIGRQLVLSPCIHDVQHPPTLDAFTDLVLDLRKRIAGKLPEVEAVDQPTEHLGFEAQIGFTDDLSCGAGGDAPQMPEGSKAVYLPGHWVTLPYDIFEGRVMLVRYDFTLDRAMDVHVLFNTPQRVRVWVDGSYAFGRDGGAMCPTFHRAPLHQQSTQAMRAGPHQVLAAVYKPPLSEPIQWVFGLSHASDKPAGEHDWLVNVPARK